MPKKKPKPVGPIFVEESYAFPPSGPTPLECLECLEPFAIAAERALKALRTSLFTTTTQQKIKATYADEMDRRSIAESLTKMDECLEKVFRINEPDVPKKATAQCAWHYENVDVETNKNLHRLNDAVVDLMEWIEASIARGPLVSRPSLPRLLVDPFEQAATLLIDKMESLRRDEGSKPSNTPAGTTEGKPVNEVNDARHSIDFASVNWYGVPYTFTTNQAACVRVLWKAWEGKTPVLGGITIIDAAGVDRSDERLDLVFRDNPAWGTMIDSPSKGRYCLKAPDAAT